jgi:peptidyl-prolyl cis-trans isomerase D
MQRPQSPEQPVFTQVALSNGDQVLVRLNGVNDDQGELQPQELAMYRQFLASRVGQEDFAAYRRQLQASAEIERF